MPIGDARTLQDLVDGAVDRLEISCQKCERVGDYSLLSLLEQHGAACELPNLLVYLSRNCPKRAGPRLDRCGAAFRFDVE